MCLHKILCENWREYKGKDVVDKGSLFVGEKIDDAITAKISMEKTYLYLFRR